MNLLIQELAHAAAQRTGTNLMQINPEFVAALVGMVVARCADVADRADVYQTYNIGGEICEDFGLTE